MTMNLLRHIAGSRLPISFHRPEEIDQVRILRAAGLVIALIPAPSNARTFSGMPTAAQVLAITAKGREELARFDYPEAPPTRWRDWLLHRPRRRRGGAPGPRVAASAETRPRPPA